MADKTFEFSTTEFSTTALDKAIDGLCSIFKKGKDIASAELGLCFKKYLKNAFLDYNNVKTLVSRDTPREIIGKDSIYVSISVIFENKKNRRIEVISTETVQPLLKLSNHILIEGTGGAGKTMLMKHLFVNTIKNEFYIPVFVRLNKISGQPVDDISIYNLIYSAIREFSNDISDRAFKYSLENGKYLFLFDGFDEIVKSHSEEASIAINNFCRKYPNNPCIVTSRPEDFSKFKSFTFVNMMPLSKGQAIELAGKTGMDDEKTKEFCNQLDRELFKKHKSFAKNPLLLSMMFLTFLENGSVPDKIVDFYDRAYNALYNNHDNFKDGYFKRVFESSLKPDEFKNVFSYFCFHTYMAQKYNFTKDEIIRQIEKSMNKCEVDEKQAEKYLNDLIKAVCLIVKEGTSYVFAHRSFQTYFAAFYTEKLEDKKQKSLFNKLLSIEHWTIKEDYYKILIQLMEERFWVNVLEDSLRSLGLHNTVTEKYIIEMFKLADFAIISSTNHIELHFKLNKIGNIFTLFGEYKQSKAFQKCQLFSNEKSKKRFYELSHKFPIKIFSDDNLHVSEVEYSNRLTDKEKTEFYLLAIKESRFDKFLIEIHNLLISSDEKREKLNKSVNYGLLAMIEDF